MLRFIRPPSHCLARATSCGNTRRNGRSSTKAVALVHQHNLLQPVLDGQVIGYRNPGDSGPGKSPHRLYGS